MGLNNELLKLASWRQQQTKEAFVPAAGGGGAPPMDPMAGGGGAPPMDPAMMGGGGGAPPMDPMAGGGGAPPMDPMMMAALGGGGAPADPAAGGGMGGSGDIRQIIREELGNAGVLPQGAGKPGGPAAAGKGPKADINTIAIDVFQLKKMFLHYLRIQGVELPPDILDGPNRDPQTGEPTEGVTGGSDVSGGAGPAGGADSAIKPIEPMQGAFPAGGAAGIEGGGGGGGEKIGSQAPRAHLENSVQSKAAKTAALLRRRRTADGEPA